MSSPSPSSDSTFKIFDITGMSSYMIRQHLIKLQHEPRFFKHYGSIANFLDRYDCDIIINFVKFVRNKYGSRFNYHKWWSMVDSFLRNYFSDSWEITQLEKNDFTITLGVIFFSSNYSEKKICYNILSGAAAFISDNIKMKLISNNDPDIAKFGSTISKIFIERFLDFMFRYNKTVYTEENWECYKLMFFREYITTLSLYDRKLFFDSYNLNTLDKSLKVIAFNLL